MPAFRHDPNGTVHIEQSYVQSFVPVELVLRTPLMLVAGGGFTGSCWETTPDGRDGWLIGLLAQGFAVDLLDHVERGRAGWCAIPGLWSDAAVQRTEQEMWQHFRIGSAEDYESRRPFDGSQFPVAALGDMLCRSVPRWPGNDLLAIDALRAVVDAVGSRVLVGHSHGGWLSAQVAAGGGSVPAIVLIEPNALPATGELGPGHPPVLIVTGDFTDRGVWRKRVREWDRYCDDLTAIGTVVERIDLPALGIVGNSHNPMMDRNSDEVLGLITAWLIRLRSMYVLV